MRLPIVKQDGTEYRDASELSTLLASAGDNLYLLAGQTWHGGIHISEDAAPWAKDIHPVRCVADGEVVAYRMMPDYLTSEFKGETYRYSNSFCLVRHHLENPEGEQKGFSYYSLYMHLCPWNAWPSAKRYRLQKRWNVRNSVPHHGDPLPTVTLPAGEIFEPVEGEALQQGKINGVSYDFMRIRILSDGASNSQVDATKGNDALWIAQDESVKEKVSIARPAWIYGEVEAVLKTDMHGRADPKTQKGTTGYAIAGDPAHLVPEGTRIQFDAHHVRLQEIEGKARKMARCIVEPSGRAQWICVEEQYLEVAEQKPTQLGELYELPSPVSIKAGDVIGYLGLYEGPASLEGGKAGNAMIHLEVFSTDEGVKSIVESEKWKEDGFRLVDGSDCDGVLDPENVPAFFQSLCASDDGTLDADAVISKLTSKAAADERHRIVARHNSEWWTPTSETMIARFKEIYTSPESHALIDHELERVKQLGWMDKTSRLGFDGPDVWHFYPLALHEKQPVPYNFSDRHETIRTIVRTCRANGISMEEQIAYVLATVERETGNTFEPVIEAYWLSEDYRKENFPYYPYYGRGFVQITWKYNYEKYSKKLGIDLVSNPDLALENENSLFILVDGFKNGVFTGKKLADYINSRSIDFFNARRCINGLDHAQEIAESARNYLTDLRNGLYD